MEQEAERGRFFAAAKARLAERAAGYELEQAFECAASREKESGRADYVQHTANCAGKNDYSERRQGVSHFVWRQCSAGIGCSRYAQGTIFSLSGDVRCCALVVALVAVRTRETSRVTSTS